MADAAKKRWTIGEFLEWDDGADRRYELVRGEIIAMNPPSPIHGTIAANLAAIIHRQLKPPCRVIAEAGIVLAARDDTYYQADLAVTCAPLSTTNYVEQPQVILEVISPSTAQHDVNWKFLDYQEIEAVREIVFVWWNARRVQHWTRVDAGWLVATARDGAVALQSLGVALPIDEIYANTGL